jgi:hypothetical protein
MEEILIKIAGLSRDFLVTAHLLSAASNLFPIKQLSFTRLTAVIANTVVLLGVAFGNSPLVLILSSLVAISITLWGLFTAGQKKCNCFGSLNEILEDSTPLIRALIVTAATALLLISCIPFTRIYIDTKPLNDLWGLLFVNAFYLYLLFVTSSSGKNIKRKSQRTVAKADGAVRRDYPRDDLYTIIRKFSLKNDHAAILFTLPKCNPCKALLDECDAVAHLLTDRVVVATPIEEKPSSRFRMWTDLDFALSKKMGIHDFPFLVEIGGDNSSSIRVVHGSDFIKARLINLLGSSYANAQEVMNEND